MKRYIKTTAIIVLGIVIGLVIFPLFLAVRIALSVWNVLYYSTIYTYKYSKDLITYAKQEGSK